MKPTPKEKAIKMRAEYEQYDDNSKERVSRVCDRMISAFTDQKVRIENEIEYWNDIKRENEEM